ncbi:choice-of-anchor X domain-containing protein [Massilia sp. METH4]|uniref:choice-of-anchor X domain-containing protein n=1 Tax=Massilia sp. METH4 TaxID=3123041 RepID=UPI0030CEAA43
MKWSARAAAGRMMVAAALGAIVPLAGMAPAGAQTVPVAVNMPATVSGAVVPGATSLDIPFSVAGADGLRLELIAPVDGVSLTLLDPAGNVVIAPGDPRATFRPGSLASPALPGGIFEIAELPEPLDGTWTIRLAFPAAPGKTVALGTVFARSRYQVGVAVERDTLLVGEDVSLGLLVLEDGQPITGLAPTIALNGGAPLGAADDGQGADGKADDGVYSVDHTFTAAGDYTITGNVAIPTPKGTINRTATARVKAVSPQLNNATVGLTTLRGANNCVSSLRVDFGFNVLKAARYSTLVRLTAPNGRSIDVRKAAGYGTGASSVTAEYKAADIRTRLGADGPYAVALIDALELGNEQFTLAYRQRDAGTFTTSLAQLCSGAIEVQPQLTATPILRDGHIDRFRLAFPITVTNGGFYQISYKVVGPNGEDIELVNASRSLVAGANNVEVELASDRFQVVDGPYRAISLVVLQGSNSARVATIGSTAAYSRWQFYPKKAGDLDGDGLVGANDAALLSQQRGAPVYTPGDRRDINRDGTIDIRDVRALQQLR